MKPAKPKITFVDISATTGTWNYSQFAKEISWMADTGISTGYDIGSGKREYRPYQPVARDAMAAFLYRYAQR